MPAKIELNFSIQPHTLAEGFTQSELAMLDECAFKWNLRYNNLLQKADKWNWHLYVGSAWHKFQELWRKNRGEIDLSTGYFDPIPKDVPQDSEFEKWLEYWNKVMPAYQQTYAKLYPEECKHEWFAIETVVEMEFLGYKLRGMIDLASTKPRFIRDFKSTSSAWLISSGGWHFKLQFMYYCWLFVEKFPEWQGQQFNFQLDIMQRPGLKQTKADGTWAGHIQRVCADVKERPEFYLTRQQSLVTPESIAHFEHHVLTPKIQRIALVVENPEVADAIIMNPNTNACNNYGAQCDFFEICEKGIKAGIFFFEQRTHKHSELAGKTE